MHSHQHHDCQSSHHCHCHNHNHSHVGQRQLWHVYGLEIATAILLVAGIIIGHLFTLPAPAILAVYIAAILPIGIPTLREMLESWRQGSVMNEFTLMVAAAIGAFIIGEYPEAVAVLLFYSFGEKMEGQASDRARDRIRALIGSLPDVAIVKDADGTIRSMSPRELQPGTVLIVKPGERVPIDATLLGNDEIAFDTSAITGEAVPRTYSPGAEIASGLIPVDKAIELRTLRPFADSSMSRILHMIEDAQATKSPTETMLRRITRYYTPAVFIMALLLFAVPAIVAAINSETFAWADWLRRSLVFLVCSCPCALVVSIPLSYFASLGAATRRGLLFKGSKYLDAMRQVDTVVLDKTGTLTTGSFHIASIAPATGITAERLLTVAAALEVESSHPLAKAITDEAQRRGLTIPAASSVTTVNHGITGSVDRQPCAAGSLTLMKSLGVDVPQADTADGSRICVACDGHYIGSLYLLDTVKAEAADTLKRLHRLGVDNIVILSGDRQEAVKRVAAEVGADSYRASLLPADKQKAVTRLHEEGHRVAFVGDGINDAPAIAAADVGIAMGREGTDMAINTSDVVISTDDLGRLPEAVRISRRVRRVIIENVSFALGIKLLVMTLGAFGIATLWAAVFADTGVTLITIIWTLLCLRK